MIVPHSEKKMIRLTTTGKTIKYALIFCGFCLFLTGGILFNYLSQTKLTIDEKNELSALRTVNKELSDADAKKQTQIEELAKNLSALQKNMDEFNHLDRELRNFLSNGQNKDISLKNSPGSTSFTGNLGGPETSATVQDVENLVKDLKIRVNNQQESFNALKEAVANKKAAEIATPSIWPTNGEITSGFGWRTSPWGSWGEWHPGVDIANDSGTPIVSTAKGVVTLSSYEGGYGNLIIVDHGNGIETAYGHNSRNLVREGQTVQKGETIAHMGSTGFSTGPHVHYEVRVNGTAVNPAGFW